jgi:hypothetical protein
MRIAGFLAGLWTCLAMVLAGASAARADDENCRIEPRLRMLPACQATLCAAAASDPAFHRRLLKVEATLDWLATMLNQSESSHHLRDTLCKVLFLDPTTAPLRTKPTRDSGELFMIGEEQAGLRESMDLGDVVKDQALFKPEADKAAAAFNDAGCAGQIGSLASRLTAQADAQQKRSEEYDGTKCVAPPADAPRHRQSCTDFIANYKRLHDVAFARKVLGECKDGCSDEYACRYPRIVKIGFQDAARDLAAYKAQCAPQNATFFADAEKTATEINALSRAATKNCPY